MNDTASAERWFFYQDATSLWKWARLDRLGSVVGNSDAAFASREACLENARTCGFRETPVVPKKLAVLENDRGERNVLTRARRI